jgi:hypothetical protein
MVRIDSAKACQTFALSNLAPQRGARQSMPVPRREASLDMEASGKRCGSWFVRTVDPCIERDDEIVQSGRVSQNVVEATYPTAIPKTCPAERTYAMNAIAKP